MVTAVAIYNREGKLLAATSHFAELFESAQTNRLHPATPGKQTFLSAADLLIPLVTAFAASYEPEQQTMLMFQGSALHCTLRRLEEKAGEPLCQVEIADAAVLQETTAQLSPQRDEAEIGRLTGRLLHDCKNQLSGLKLYAAWLKKRMAAAQAENNGIFLEEASIVEKLINGLNLVAEHASYVSRLAQPLHLKKSPADLSLLLGQVADETQALAAARNIRLIVEAAADLPHYLCDALLMVTALNSLVIRALNVSREKTIIRLTHQDRTLQLEIRDDHEAVVTPEQCLNLFSFPAEEKLTTAILGMALARKIIEQHQGQIIANPNTPSGTIITIRFNL